MVRSKTTRLVVLTAGLAALLPTAAAQAGGGAPPIDPPIVGVPIARTQVALGNAADAIDAGAGGQAVGPLRASRRYLIRSYKGAKYLIANAPPPPVGDGSANPRRFIRLARRAVRASRRAGSHGWIRAGASGTGAAGPVFADGPTAVFDVFTSQFNAATAAVGMVPDAKGALLTRVQTTLNTAVVLRNRLVKIIHAAEPPAPPVADGRVHARASGAPVGATFGSVMPGLTVLLDAELQQMKAMQEDTSVPSASRDALTKAISADTQVEALVNQYWPPVVGD
jgi:hypothetical protein